MTTADLALYWGVSRKAIYKQIDAGTLTAIRLGRLVRISTAEAIRFEGSAKMSPMPTGRIASHGSRDEAADFDKSKSTDADALHVRVGGHRRRANRRG